MDDHQQMDSEQGEYLYRRYLQSLQSTRDSVLAGEPDDVFTEALETVFEPVSRFEFQSQLVELQQSDPKRYADFIADLQS